MGGGANTMSIKGKDHSRDIDNSKEKQKRKKKKNRLGFYLLRFFVSGSNF